MKKKFLRSYSWRAGRTSHSWQRRADRWQAGGSRGRWRWQQSFLSQLKTKIKVIFYLNLKSHILTFSPWPGKCLLCPLIASGQTLVSGGSGDQAIYTESTEQRDSTLPNIVRDPSVCGNCGSIPGTLCFPWNFDLHFFYFFCSPCWCFFRPIHLTMWCESV